MSDRVKIVRSPTLGIRVLICDTEAERPEDAADLVRYTWKEAALLKEASAEVVKAAHLVKKTFGGTIIRAESKAPPEQRNTKLYPTTGDKSTCKRCSAVIYWAQADINGNKVGGKSGWMPVDPDGKSHYTSCPHADEFSSSRRQQS